MQDISIDGNKKLGPGEDLYRSCLIRHIEEQYASHRCFINADDLCRANSRDPSLLEQRQGSLQRPIQICAFGREEIYAVRHNCAEEIPS
jgi:hypothetical protein